VGDGVGVYEVMVEFGCDGSAFGGLCPAVIEMRMLI
jgi:hypothetical protein